MKNILKKLWWVILLVVIIGLVVFYYINKSNAPKVEYTTEKVKRGELMQTVEATGNIEPAKKINLNFQSSGILSKKNVEVGRDVKEGAVLLALDEKNLQYQVDQAAANLAQAQANLDKMIAGAGSKEINVTQKSAAQAQVEYENAKANYDLVKKQQSPSLNTYETSFNKAQNDLIAAKQSQTDITASQNQNLTNLYNSALISIDKGLADCDIALDETNRILSDSEGKNFLGILNPQAVNDQIISRVLAQNSITAAQASVAIAKASLTDTSIDEALTGSTNAINKTFENLVDVFDILSASVTTFTFPDSVLNSYKTSVSNKQTVISTDLTSVQTTQQNILSSRLTRDAQINTASASVASAQKAVDLAQANYDLALSTQDTQLNSAQSQVNSAKAAYDVAEAQLDYKKAPAREVDLAAYRASIKQMQAAYNLAKNNLQDTELVAPMNGTITAVNYEIGEQVPLGTAAITIMSVTGFNIKVDISESDIAKIKLNDKVDITLDALGEEEIFSGTVAIIEPAPTIIQEVIYYKVQVDFDQSSSQIKSGMTANLTIQTDRRDNALFIPRRAIIERDGKKIVRLLENGLVREVEVTTGLKADDGLIEILSGLTENQDVITFEKEL